MASNERKDRQEITGEHAEGIGYGLILGIIPEYA
jgi:hypothetical protein